MYDTSTGCLDCPPRITPVALSPAGSQLFLFSCFNKYVFEDMVDDVRTRSGIENVSVLMGWALWSRWINDTSLMPSDFAISDNHRLQQGYLGVTTNARLFSDGYNSIAESFLEPKHVYVTSNHIARADITTAANGLALIKRIGQDIYLAHGKKI